MQELAALKTMLVRRICYFGNSTQPSGPSCLWQCFYTTLDCPKCDVFSEVWGEWGYLEKIIVCAYHAERPIPPAHCWGGTGVSSFVFTFSVAIFTLLFPPFFSLQAVLWGPTRIGLNVKVEQHLDRHTYCLKLENKCLRHRICATRSSKLMHFWTDVPILLLLWTKTLELKLWYFISKILKKYNPSLSCWAGF